MTQLRTPASVLATATLAFIATHAAQAATDSAPAVLATSYAGGNLVGVRWQDTNLASACGIDAYGLFARSPGGDFEFKADLRETTDRFWFGPVTGLSETTPLELKISRKTGFGSDTSYCDTPEENTAAVDTTSVNNPPSFTSQGDIQLTSEQLNGSSAFGTTFITIENWASDITDGDGDTQDLINDHVFSLGNGPQAFFDDYFGEPGPDVVVAYRKLDNQDYVPDGFSVFRFCDSGDTPLSDQWVGACTQEVPTIISADPSLPGAANYPDFNIPSSLEIGSDYSEQTHEYFATNVTAGASATPSSDLLFSTLWITNPHLFESLPYLSTPSGSLRFQFKPAVSGTSRVYFVLSDVDAQRTGNNAPYYGGSWLPNVRSPIRYIDIQVGDVSSESANAPGVSGQGLITPDVLDNASDSTAATSGGGALGFGALMLSAFAAVRRRRSLQS